MQDDTIFEDNNTNVTDETSNDVDTQVDTTEEVDVEKLKETNRRLYARLKEAEAEAKKLKSTPAPKASIQKPSNYEADLLRVAKGYDDELIGTLEVISKGSGKTLIQAQEDPMFKLILDKRQAEDREAKAKLGASKGSNQFNPKSIKEMSKEEHMAYVKEAMLKFNH